MSIGVKRGTLIFKYKSIITKPFHRNTSLIWCCNFQTQQSKNEWSKWPCNCLNGYLKVFILEPILGLWWIWGIDINWIGGGGDVVLSCPLTNPKKVHATNHLASMWRDLNHLKPWKSNGRVFLSTNPSANPTKHSMLQPPQLYLKPPF